MPNQNLEVREIGSRCDDTRRVLVQMSEDVRLVESLLLLYCRGDCTIDTLIEFLIDATGRMRKDIG